MAVRPSLTSGRDRWSAVTAKVRAARFTGRFDLFVRSDVWLRNLNVLPGTGNLAFVTFGESLIHNSRLHPAVSCIPMRRSWVLILAYGQVVAIRTSTLRDEKGHVLKNTDLAIEGGRITGDHRYGR